MNCSCFLPWFLSGHGDGGCMREHMGVFGPWTISMTVGEVLFFIWAFAILVPMFESHPKLTISSEKSQGNDTYLPLPTQLPCLPAWTFHIFFSLLRHFSAFCSSLEDVWMQVCRVLGFLTFYLMLWLTLSHSIRHIAGAFQSLPGESGKASQRRWFCGASQRMNRSMAGGQGRLVFSWNVFWNVSWGVLGVTGWRGSGEECEMRLNRQAVRGQVFGEEKRDLSWRCWGDCWRSLSRRVTLKTLHVWKINLAATWTMDWGSDPEVGHFTRGRLFV